MKIREVQIVDAEALQKINEESLRYQLPIDAVKKQLETLILSPTNQLFIAEIDGQVVGYVQVSEYLSTYASKLGNIMALAVDQHFQGYGVGKRLMETAENWSKSIGAIGVRLNSGEERVEAHKFYEHIGYQKKKYQANLYKALKV